MTENNRLTNEAELFGSKPKRRYKLLDPLPVSGHRVRIQSLTEREVSQYQAVTIARDGHRLRPARLEDANRRLIVLCLVDQAGNRILSTNHLAKLADWDAADTGFLYDECAAHAGINTQDIEDLVKNSEKTSVVGSPSGSPGE